jgi:ring-1,2-phenylacetyl-CoA epoxidase subunit PaaC
MATDPRLDLVFAYGDDELILGHRLSEWTGWVPFVEEDLALSSIAQDEMAHARAYLQIASDLTGTDLDALALGRGVEEYRHAIVCERPNVDFAFTIARQWLYDSADAVRVEALRGSAFAPIAQLAAVLTLEERYHLEHTQAWFARLANGPVDARHRFAAALSVTLPFALALFEPLASEDALLADGTLTRSHDEMRAEWLAGVRATLDDAGLQQVFTDTGEMIPTSSGAIESAPVDTTPWEPIATGVGGRHGKHSEDWPAVWEEMTALYRAHPGATW